MDTSDTENLKNLNKNFKVSNLFYEKSLSYVLKLSLVFTHQFEGPQSSFTVKNINPFKKLIISSVDLCHQSPFSK